MKFGRLVVSNDTSGGDDRQTAIASAKAVPCAVILLIEGHVCVFIFFEWQEFLAANVSYR
jgi:hypothetical protein